MFEMQTVINNGQYMQNNSRKRLKNNDDTFQPEHLSPENLAERLDEAMPCHNYQVLHNAC